MNYIHLSKAKQIRGFVLYGPDERQLALSIYDRLNELRDIQHEARASGSRRPWTGCSYDGAFNETMVEFGCFTNLEAVKGLFQLTKENEVYRHKGRVEWRPTVPEFMPRYLDPRDDESRQEYLSRQETE